MTSDPIKQHIFRQFRKRPLMTTDQNTLADRLEEKLSLQSLLWEIANQAGDPYDGSAPVENLHKANLRLLKAIERRAVEAAERYEAEAALRGRESETFPEAVNREMLEALKAVDAVSKSGADTISLLTGLHRVAKQCRRAIAKAEALSSTSQVIAEGWRTIDSAPKDGTTVLLYDGLGVVAGAYAAPMSLQDWWDTVDGEGPPDEREYQDYLNYEPPGWMTHEPISGDEVRLSPVLWLPMPTASASSEVVRAMIKAAKGGE